MNVLITGGAGFIGSHLVDTCIARGDDVTVLDDLSSGRRENLVRARGLPNFRFVEGSVTDTSLVAEAVGRCDQIYHVAAAVGMRMIIDHTLHTFEVNVRGTEVVFAEAAAQGRRVLFTSTSEVYGLNEHKPSCESDNAVLGDTAGSRWAYAYSKAMGEVLAGAYRRERGLAIVVARLFNTVGPRQTGRYGMVVPTFVRQALGNRPITVHGDGTQTRCFSDVGEVTKALTALMNDAAATGKTRNVGGDHEIRILDLARRVKLLAGSRSDITFVSHRSVYGNGFDEIARRVPDLALLRATIGFAPERGLDEILTSVIAEQRGMADVA